VGSNSDEVCRRNRCRRGAASGRWQT